MVRWCWSQRRSATSTTFRRVPSAALAAGRRDRLRGHPPHRPVARPPGHRRAQAARRQRAHRARPRTRGGPPGRARESGSRSSPTRACRASRTRARRWCGRCSTPGWRWTSSPGRPRPTRRWWSAACRRGASCSRGSCRARGRAAIERLAEVAAEHRTIVLYEAPHRLARTLRRPRRACGGDRRVALLRELTKLHEEHWRGTLAEALARTDEVEPRGEYVVVVEGAAPDEPADDAVLRAALAEARGRRSVDPRCRRRGRRPLRRPTPPRLRTGPRGALTSDATPGDAREGVAVRGCASRS